MIKFLFPIVVLFPMISMAEPSPADKVGEAVQEGVEKVTHVLNETRVRREKESYYVLANYSPLDLLIPNKYGLTVGLIQDADRTWELEYLRGSMSVPFIVEDLGKMTDQRFSLIKRSYFGGNSFNLSYGLSYFDFSIHLGDKLLSRASGGTYPGVDLVEVQSLGFNVAIGNRWSFEKNVTFGVDWVSWAQPLFITSRKSAFTDYTSNAQDKNDVDAATKTIAYFPRLAFLKLQLGILF